MEYKIYMVEDNLDKQACLPKILKKMKENEADHFVSGFGDDLTKVYLNYDLLSDKIEESDPRSSYWLIDLQMKGGHKVAQQLVNKYFSSVSEYQQQISTFPARIRADSAYQLALALIGVLEKKGIPVAANSTANMAIPDYKIVAEHYNLIDYPVNPHAKGTISKAAEQILSDIKERLQNPVERFLTQIKKSDCHIAEGDFTCFKILSDFLCYSSVEELLEVLKLGDKKKYSGSLIEEALKSFSTGGENGYSLIGMVLICWAAFRSIARNRTDFNESYFPSLLEKKEKEYQKVKKRNSEELSYFKKIARNGSMCPSQDFSTFKKTLRALSDMIRPLYVNDQNNKPTLEQLSLTNQAFCLHLSISNNLITTLNEVQFNLLDAIDTGRFKREHTTSMRIYKFLYYNSLSTYQDSNTTQNRFNFNQWGPKSLINITPYKSGNGVKLKFSLC